MKIKAWAIVLKYNDNLCHFKIDEREKREFRYNVYRTKKEALERIDETYGKKNMYKIIKVLITRRNK